MSQRTTGRIEIGPDDALPDLLLRVKATRGDEVVIGIPGTSGVLVTASEFRTLKSTADQVRVAVRLETNDKLRGQLASMFGFDHGPYLSEEQQAATEDHPSWPTPEARLPPVRVTLPPGDLTTSKPWRDEPVDASSGFAVPPKPVARPEFAMEPRTGAIAKQEPEARAKTKPSTIIWTIVGILAALSVAAVLSVVLRTGEITVRTPREPVSAEMTMGYATDGVPVPGLDITLNAILTDFTVPLEFTAPATGALDNQGGKAIGTVALRNISGKRVRLPAGTRLQASDGTVYLTTSDVEIGSGDAEKPAKGEVAIEAEKPGAVANRDPGVLTGQVPEFPGVYFGNVGAPVSGGTDLIVKVVTEQDIAQAQAKALADLTTSAGTFRLPDGRIVIPSTVQPVGDPTVAVDRVAGDQAESFTVTAQGQFQALTIDPDELPDEIRASIRNQLAQRAPAGYALTDDPIEFANPREASPGAGALTLTVSVDAARQLSADEIARIRDLTRGKSQDDARAALATMPDLQVVEIRVSPAILVKSLPGADKITVRSE
jgi:hypothetical protein